MEKYKSVFVYFFVLCVLYVIFVFSQDGIDYFDLGLKNLKERNWLSAEFNFKKYKEKNPTDPDVYDLLGTIYANVGDYSRAIEEFKNAIRLNVNHPTSHNNLGIVYKILGYEDEAISEFKQSIIINLNLLIELNTEERKIKGGKGEISQQDLNSKKNIIYNNLYFAYSNLGDYEKAKEFFSKITGYEKEIVSLNEKYDFLKDSKKEIRNGGKEAKEDVIETEKFIEKLILNGEYDKAKEEIINLFKKGELSNANLHTNLGIIYQKMGLIREAIAEHRIAIQLAPNHPTAHNNLGHSLEANGKFEEAIEEYKKAITINPELVIAYQNLGNLYLKLGRFKEGIEIIEKAIKIEPQNSLSYNLLSYLFYQGGELQNSFEVMKEARIKFPGDGLIQKNFEFIKQKLQNKKIEKEKLKNEKTMQTKPFLKKGAESITPVIKLPSSKLPDGKSFVNFKDSPISEFYELIKVKPEDLSAKFVLSTNSGWIWIIDIKKKTIMPITEGFSPSLVGESVFYMDWVDFYPQVFEYQISNFKRTQLTFSKRFKKNVEVSPNGSIIGYIEGTSITDSDIWVYDVKNKRNIQLTKDLWISSFKWLGDDEQILFSSEKCGVDLNYEKSCVGIINLMDKKIQWVNSNYMHKKSLEKFSLGDFYNFTFSTLNNSKKVIISTKKGNSYIPLIDLSTDSFDKIYPFEKFESLILMPFWGKNENIIFFISGRDFYVFINNNGYKIVERIFTLRDNVLSINQVK